MKPPVAGDVVDIGGCKQRRRLKYTSSPGCLRAQGKLAHFAQPVLSFADVAEHVPVDRHRGTEDAGLVDVASIERPPQRGTNVVVLGVQHWNDGVGLRDDRLAQADTEGYFEVAMAAPEQLALVCVFELSATKTRERGAHREPGLATNLADGQQRLVYQHFEQLRDALARERIINNDRTASGQREPATEYAEPAEQLLLVVGQQREAPRDRLLEALMTWHERCATATKHVQLAIEPLEQLGRRHRCDPSSGQLDGKR